MNTQSESVEVQVARLDERQLAMGKVIDEIKDNHLVHIAADIKELRLGQEKTDNRLAKWGGGAAAVLFLLQLISLYVSMKATQSPVIGQSMIASAATTSTIEKVAN